MQSLDCGRINPYDIVAGASIGAVNAAILVDNVIHNENKDLNSEETWKQAIARLESFYEKISERGVIRILCGG